MKVVINACFGGFGLSPRAVMRYAELKGRQCYLFKFERSAGHRLTGRYISASPEQLANELIWVAFDIPNPNDVIPNTTETWRSLSQEERRAANEIHERHEISNGSRIDRADPDLVRVVEELGPKASGELAQLKVVEIPDGTEYTIEEYDGREHVAQVHETWS